MIKRENISKMSDLPLAELTLRKYEKPYQENEREIVKKICLSLGLLQPGDSRDIIVEILLVLNKAKKEKEELELEKIKERAIELRKTANLEIKGLTDSNIRRQLKRLRDLLIIEKISNSYRVSEFEDLSKIFDEKIKDFYLLSITTRIKEYLKVLEQDKAE